MGRRKGTKRKAVRQLTPLRSSRSDPGAGPSRGNSEDDPVSGTVRQTRARRRAVESLTNSISSRNTARTTNPEVSVNEGENSVQNGDRQARDGNGDRDGDVGVDIPNAEQPNEGAERESGRQPEAPVRPQDPGEFGVHSVLNVDSTVNTENVLNERAPMMPVVITCVSQLMVPSSASCTSGTNPIYVAANNLAGGVSVRNADVSSSLGFVSTEGVGTLPRMASTSGMGLSSIGRVGSLPMGSQQAQSSLGGVGQVNTLTGVDQVDRLRGVGQVDTLRGVGQVDTGFGVRQENTVLRGVGPVDTSISSVGIMDTTLRGVGHVEAALRGTGQGDMGLRGIGHGDALRGVGYGVGTLRGAGQGDGMTGSSAALGINTSTLGNISNSTSAVPSIDSHMLGLNLPSNPFNPLTSVCSGLGDGLPLSLRNKIINSEYIEFGTILEKTENMGTDPKQFSLSVEEGGAIVWKDNKPKRPITSIHIWTSAFLIFAGVYLRAHPGRTQELLKYCHIVRTAASRHVGWGWRSYDAKFRMRQSQMPHRSWAVIDGELWAIYVSGSPSFQSFRIGNGADKSTMSKNFRPSNPTKTNIRGRNESQAAMWRQVIANKACFDFNSGGCSRSKCKFFHKCSQCNSTAHGAKACKQTQKS